MLRSLGEYLYGCRGMINVAQNESIIILLFFFPATFDSLAYKSYSSTSEVIRWEPRVLLYNIIVVMSYKNRE